LVSAESPTRTEGPEGATLDFPDGAATFTPGQVLGERYQILELLGRGGMGEVWHALDLKLRTDVALKALRGDLFKSERRLELLRQEVRAAREVVSPNVCRIFDLIEIEERELVSMEYVDGATLLGVLQERGPLELKEAQDIASQFLAGLEAIHRAGLVHRDVKPENIMLTRAGRVVVMDFGLARQEAEGGGSVSGTPAYMAPEQAAGQTLDARADVYAAGVVLAEMVSPEGIKGFESRQTVWEGVRSEPAKVPDTPWAPVLKKAVAKDREHRYNSAHTLTRALEDVTLRVEGAEDLHPYPGLASFTEQDAEYFFGREAEVEQMWRRFVGAPRLLALAGPSGSGKTSFLQAGLVPRGGPEWQCLVCKPGNNPELALSRALGSELSGDAGAVDLLLRFDDSDVAVEVVTLWRSRVRHALLIVDQFEELFTLNPAEVQRRFAELIGRLVLEADVLVLVSMRDDFLFNCHQHEPLRPVLADLTMLGPPEGAALRRALVQPATRCGYRFEDDELVEEMLAEVEGERGALPLLAFAIDRLWEKRDRESGLLTRQAYQDIGGVGGALARHAEATIDRIGSDRVAIVRELFRNLVTAEGTRAVREWDELSSVFGDPNRESAREVLSELIDARLLTSYEVSEEDRETTRRVEIIHESLLANWPRLVRWRTQDQEGAQLRDELRQAARAWGEHGRHDDRLWTGTAYREFALWRERYPGGLTELEESFAQAMTFHAKRRRRRRRLAAASVLLIATLAAVVFAGLWRRSVRETRRAEAAKLVALAQLEQQEYPTALVAHAIASLELADTAEARLLALEALWRGPTAQVLPLEAGGPFYRMAISPDGRWLATISPTGQALLYPWDGGPSLSLSHPPTAGGQRSVFFGPDGTTVVMGFDDIYIRSVPEGELIRTLDVGPGPYALLAVGVDRIVALSLADYPEDSRALVSSWPTVGGDRETVGIYERQGVTSVDADPTGTWIAFVRDHQAYLLPVEGFATARNTPVGPSDEGVVDVTFSSRGDRLALSAKSEGTLRVIVWPMPGTSGGPVRVPEIEMPTGRSWPRIGPTGSQVALLSSSGKAAYVWDLNGPPDARHTALRRVDVENFWHAAFDPSGQWLATLHDSSISFWPLSGPRVRVLQRPIQAGTWLTTSADGRWLASCAMTDSLRLWPLTSGEGASRSIGSECYVMAAHPSRAEIVTEGIDGALVLTPIEDGPTAELIGRVSGFVMGVSFDQEGSLLAVPTGYAQNPNDKVLRVLDLENDRVLTFPQMDKAAEASGDYDPSAAGILETRFTPDGTLYSGGMGGVRRWDVQSGTQTVMYEAELARFDLSRDGKYVLAAGGQPDSPGYLARSELRLFDLESGLSRAITTHGDTVNKVAFDPSGRTIVTVDGDGNVRVGPVSGEEPHLLLGHDGRITGVAVSPDGRWIYTAGGGEIRLWPMPDLSKPPLHTLPRTELIAKLKTLTNLRLVRDEESSTGWKLGVGPFPGWASVPEW
jgi:WD40 repeat protein